MPGDSAYIMLCYFCNDRKKSKPHVFIPLDICNETSLQITERYLVAEQAKCPILNVRWSKYSIDSTATTVVS